MSIEKESSQDFQREGPKSGEAMFNRGMKMSLLLFLSATWRQELRWAAHGLMRSTVAARARDVTLQHLQQVLIDSK